jgi:HD superfamily phosphohydrolase
MHIARRMLQRLRETGLEIDEGKRRIVLCAALLHDTGHGPFSHAFEKVTQMNHEQYTRRIIEDSTTEVNRILSEVDGSLPTKIGEFFDENPEENDSQETPAYLVRIITSQFDADRADYLLRDSLATGTHYGRYDLDWLISHLWVEEAHNRFFFDRKSIPAIESYVFARFHMYQSVYYHKATRAAEVMLRLLFKRVKELLSDDAKKMLVPASPPLVRRAFEEQLGLQEYLALDEAQVISFFGECTSSDDQVLKQLSGSLLRRRLYKAIDATGIDAAQVATFYSSANELVRAKGYPLEYSFVDDSALDRPYKPYRPDGALDQIFVQDAYGRVKELTEVVESVHSLTSPRAMLRYYCLPELRQYLVAIRNEAFSGEAK